MALGGAGGREASKRQALESAPQSWWTSASLSQLRLFVPLGPSVARYTVSSTAWCEPVGVCVVDGCGFDGEALVMVGGDSRPASEGDADARAPPTCTSKSTYGEQ